MAITVYIAAPYTSNPEENTKKVLRVADKVLEKGYIPFIPHLNHYWHLISAKPYDEWLRIDREWLTRCDMVLRLEGESKGADGEVKIAKCLGIPVYFKEEDLPCIK